MQKLEIFATSMVFCLSRVCQMYQFCFSLHIIGSLQKCKFSLYSASPSTSKFRLHTLTEFQMVWYYSVLSSWLWKTDLKDFQTYSRLYLSISVSPWKHNRNPFSHFICDAKNSYQKTHNVFQCIESLFVCLIVQVFYNLGRLKWEQIQLTITAATQLNYCICWQFCFIFQPNHCSVLTKLKWPFLTKTTKSAFSPLSRQ